MCNICNQTEYYKEMYETGGRGYGVPVTAYPYSDDTYYNHKTDTATPIEDAAAKRAKKKSRSWRRNSANSRQRTASK
jgi:hypothetical protein